jgi:hypothetical protein
VLERHEEVWTRGWLEREMGRRATTGAEEVLALFDAFDDWFRQESYSGCLFTRSLLETGESLSPVYAASVAGLEHVRAFIRSLAEGVGVRDPETFALQIQMLMLGAIIAAVGGQVEAAERARNVARLLLEKEGIVT